MSSHLFEVKIAFSLDTYFRILCSIKLKIRKCFLKIIGHSAIELKQERKNGERNRKLGLNTSNSKLFQVAPNSNYVLETRNLISEGIFNSVTFSKKLHFSANVEIENRDFVHFFEDWTKLKISFWIKPPLYCTLRS